MPIDLLTTTKQFLRLQEFAETINMSRRTMYNWIREGKLTTVKIGGSRRVPIAEARRLAKVVVPVPLTNALASTDAADLVFRSVKSTATHH